MSDFTGLSVYQEQFDPKAYLEGYFRFGEGTLGDDFLKFSLKQFAEVFMSGKVKGKTLIDIGTGPTIHQLLSACVVFDEIIVTDYTDRNREEFEKWLNKEPGMFDWTSVLKYVCELEGNREKWQEKEEKLRRAVKQVLKCDVLKVNPVEPLNIPQVDCLLSSLCFEVACKDENAYHCALKNVSTLLKPGGQLVLCGVLDTNYYMVGNVKFSSLCLKEDFLKAALHGEGYVIEYMKLGEREEKKMQDISDYSTAYMIIARKPE